MEKEVLLYILSFVTTGLGGVIIKLYVTLGNLQSQIAINTNDIHWIKDSLLLASRKSARILHSPHTPELDALLEKYETGELMSCPEFDRMVEILDKFVHDAETDKTAKTNANIILSYVKGHNTFGHPLYKK